MTIDKIKRLMDENIFNYWTALKNGSLPHEEKRNAIYKAKEQLEKEIETGIRTEQKYIAELNLLTMFLS
jgi:hypothetical protein